tara:strand:- start:205 stop:633 length:429 start_codon:yes stop_codon:yes gene_type:complete
MDFKTEDIAQITSDACAMFGMSVASESPDESGIDLSGRIEIDGAWEGSVAMGCSHAFARKLASVMFELPDEDLDQDLINDAFGELVNVTTGNIKALLPAGCVMGVPRVMDFMDASEVGEVRIQLWGFEANGDHLMVVIRKAA